MPSFNGWPNWEAGITFGRRKGGRPRSKLKNFDCSRFFFCPLFRFRQLDDAIGKEAMELLIVTALRLLLRHELQEDNPPRGCRPRGV